MKHTHSLGHPFLETRIPASIPIYGGHLSAAACPFLADHRVGGITTLARVCLRRGSHWRLPPKLPAFRLPPSTVSRSMNLYFLSDPASPRSGSFVSITGARNTIPDSRPARWRRGGSELDFTARDLAEWGASATCPLLDLKRRRMGQRQEGATELFYETLRSQRLRSTRSCLPRDPDFQMRQWPCRRAGGAVRAVGLR